jgi:hypothetical protein
MPKKTKNKNTAKEESIAVAATQEVIKKEDIVNESSQETVSTPVESVIEENDDVEKSSQLFEKLVIDQVNELNENSVSLTDKVNKDLVKNSFEQVLNDQIKKQNPELYAQLANVGRGVEYILIKAKNSIYCYARFVKTQRPSEDSPEWELEVLANIPPAVHRDILSIAHACGTYDSRRVYFNPSGVI